jgi:hypothetical protein
MRCSPLQAAHNASKVPYTQVPKSEIPAPQLWLNCFRTRADRFSIALQGYLSLLQDMEYSFRDADIVAQHVGKMF